MKHWDLTPKQLVTLIRRDGHKIECRFLFRDTVHACFLVYDAELVGRFRQFQLMNDGGLKTAPEHADLIAALPGTGPAWKFHSFYGGNTHFRTTMRRMKRWEIQPAGVLSS